MKSGSLLALALGPTLALALWIALSVLGLPRDAAITAAITLWCAVWWVTEAIPIPITSLIPFAAFPLLGVLSGKAVAVAYGDPMILLLLGGFLLSKTVEHSGAHERIAIAMVRFFGRAGRRGLVLGFMAATALLSMWISNSATVLMLLPVAIAVIQRPGNADLSTPLLLGIAYSASIGGMGTPIGTPPNVMCMGVYEEVTGRSIHFAEWMSFGLPIVLLMVPVAWWILVRRVEPGPSVPMQAAGPWRSIEVRVMVLFAVTAAAWILRKLPILGGGWSEWIGAPGAGDETVALAAVIAAFLIPSGERRGEKLLDWNAAASIPFGILLLFAGGIAIAKAFESSGLSAKLGEALAGFATMPAVLVVGVICLSVTFATEVTSNTATTALLMPVLASAALRAGMDPKLLMVPAAISASCAFMLPVATAPNAIVFGSQRVTIAQMARTGVALNLTGVVVVGSVVLWLVH